MAKSDAPTRLGWAGKGVVLGGLLLVVAAVVLPPAVAVTVVIFGTVVAWLYELRIDRQPRIVIGVASVGAIAGVEAAGFGLGIDLLSLGGIAVLLGAFDVLAGRLLGSVRRRTTGDQ